MPHCVALATQEPRPAAPTGLGPCLQATRRFQPAVRRPNCSAPDRRRQDRHPQAQQALQSPALQLTQGAQRQHLAQQFAQRIDGGQKTSRASPLTVKPMRPLASCNPSIIRFPRTICQPARNKFGGGNAPVISRAAHIINRRQRVHDLLSAVTKTIRRRFTRLRAQAVLQRGQPLRYRRTGPDGSRRAVDLSDADHQAGSCHSDRKSPDSVARPAFLNPNSRFDRMCRHFIRDDKLVHVACRLPCPGQERGRRRLPRCETNSISASSVIGQGDAVPPAGGAEIAANGAAGLNLHTADLARRRF